MTQRYIADTDSSTLQASPDSYAFVGDSPNDEPMFSAFKHSFGVANIRTFLDRITHHPSHIVTLPGGAGFAQVVDLLLTPS